MTFTRVTRELRINRDTARLLSQSTYHELVLALRELVANAHDANAANIRIEVDLKKPGEGSIKVGDDGDGMSSQEFTEDFLNLGRASKRPAPGGGVRRNRFGRQLLGRFGIGFISAVPFAKEVLVETKRREDLLVSGIRINCEAILSGSGPGEDSSFSFPGWSRSPTEADADRFTRVEMLGINKYGFDSIDASIRSGWYETRRQRGSEVSNTRRIEYLRNWLSRILPLGYSLSGVEGPLREALGEMLPPGYIPANILVDGSALLRTWPGAQVVRPFEFEGKVGAWRAKGVLWSPHEAIQPVFARGVAVRVGDMSIGSPGYLGLNEVGRVYGKLQHITGEVQVEGLEAALRLDREGFYPTPATDEFFEAIRRKIAELEGVLQKKASIMEEFRTLKKGVDAVEPRPGSERQLAPILTVPKRIQNLTKAAQEVGIRVTTSKSDELVVPKGERQVTVGENYGERLLRVRVRKRSISFDVTESSRTLSTSQLAESLVKNSDDRVKIEGSHVLLSQDETAVANLRLMAVLKVSLESQVINRKQLESILESLAETYR